MNSNIKEPSKTPAKPDNVNVDEIVKPKNKARQGLKNPASGPSKSTSQSSKQPKNLASGLEKNSLKQAKKPKNLALGHKKIHLNQ